MYQNVLIYKPDGVFVGNAILDSQTNKLQATHVYREDEDQDLYQRISDLNVQQNLTHYWPHPQDPEVKKLVDDPDFMPLEYVATEVIDDERSTVVFHKVADPENEGAWIDGEPDYDASALAYKTVMIPARPTDSMLRIKAACEQVARERARLST